MRDPSAARPFVAPVAATRLSRDAAHSVEPLVDN